MNYKLKDGISWDNVKTAIEFIDVTNPDDDFNNYFEKIDLPVVEFNRCAKYQKLENEAEFVIDDLGTTGIKYMSVRHKNNGICLYVMMSEKHEIKSVADFNEKCSQLFGFYLKDVK